MSIRIFIGVISFFVCNLSFGAYWEIHSLGTLGGNSSTAIGINNAGQVVGNSQTEPRVLDPADPPVPLNFAFISAPNGGGLTEIGGAGYFGNSANAVNNAGQVVGLTTIGRSFPTSFITDANAANPRSYRYYSEPTGINNTGQVISNDNGPFFPAQQAYIGNQDGTGVVAINTPDMLLPDSYATAVALNDSGQVAVNGPQFGFIWDAVNGARNLIPGATRSTVIDINNDGEILGIVYSGAVAQAFITQPDGGALTLLGSPADGNTPIAINNVGQIIGKANFGGAMHAYVSQPRDINNLIDLETLSEVVAGGWSDISVAGINDSGQIAGTGLLNGQQLAFLLSPLVSSVPEPQTLLLILLGIVFLNTFRSRSRS